MKDTIILLAFFLLTPIAFLLFPEYNSELMEVINSQFIFSNEPTIQSELIFSLVYSVAIILSLAVRYVYQKKDDRAGTMLQKVWKKYVFEFTPVILTFSLFISVVLTQSYSYGTAMGFGLYIVVFGLAIISNIIYERKKTMDCGIYTSHWDKTIHQMRKMYGY